MRTSRHWGMAAWAGTADRSGMILRMSSIYEEAIMLALLRILSHTGYMRTIDNQTRSARRHATREGPTGLIYFAAPTRRGRVALLGLPPKDATETQHRADRCSCAAVTEMPADEWNRHCPPADQPDAWRVVSIP